MMLSLVLAAAVAAAAPSPSPPADAAQARIDELKQMYDQSCRQRAYGSYDDVCDNLRKQIHEAEADLRKQKPAVPAADKTTTGPQSR
ncbi:MAG: hypothetical protein AB1429_04395 [Pseudomonadota bacterium]|jgi:hypothetical protein